MKYAVDYDLRRSRLQAYKAILSDRPSRAPRSMSRPVPRGIVQSASLTAVLTAVAAGFMLACFLLWAKG